MTDNENASGRWEWLRQLVIEWLGVLGFVYERLRTWAPGRLGKWWYRALLVIGCFFLVWWNWHEITTRPGVSPALELIHCNALALPQADPHYFTVALAHLENDDAERNNRYLIDGILSEFEAVKRLNFNCTIPVYGSVPEEQQRKGHEKARELLEATNASVLIWGRVRRHEGKNTLDLYLTSVAGHSEKHKEYYPEMGDTADFRTGFRLPDFFWNDLADILRLVIATQYAQFVEKEGHDVADRLQSFIFRVRKLLEASAGRPGWNTLQRASTQYLLANALRTLGEQRGEIRFLREAVLAYEQAVKEWDDERVPYEWDALQFILGEARLSLGMLESGTVRLEQALKSFEGVLDLWPRELVPLQWAAAQHSRGDALRALGEREVGTARLEEAVKAHGAALEVFTRKEAPLDWAATQNHLGRALAALGERESGTARLEEAVKAHGAALEVLIGERELFPLAVVQKNLGRALYKLGKRTQDRAKIEEAQEMASRAFKVFRQMTGQEHRRSEFEDLLREIHEALTHSPEASRP